MPYPWIDRPWLPQQIDVVDFQNSERAQNLTIWWIREKIFYGKCSEMNRINRVSWLKRVGGALTYCNGKTRFLSYYMSSFYFFKHWLNRLFLHRFPIFLIDLANCRGVRSHVAFGRAKQQPSKCPTSTKVRLYSLKWPTIDWNWSISGGNIVDKKPGWDLGNGGGIVGFFASIFAFLILL